MRTKQTLALYCVYQKTKYSIYSRNMPSFVIKAKTYSDVCHVMKHNNFYDYYFVCGVLARVVYDMQVF